MMRSFQDILEAAGAGAPKRLVTFLREQDLSVICRAAAAGLMIPCLIGDGESIARRIARTPLASMKHEIVEEKEPGSMLERAVSLMREGWGDILMQGGFDSPAFLDAVLKPGTGLQESRVASYVSLCELTDRHRLILVTDTLLNDRPTIGEKQLILQNSLSLAAILGIDAPRVSVLSAIEQVNPSIPSTLDAAVLSKMSERGQFGKALVEGPLDVDCSLSHVAARRKGVESPVTGNVDIYLVPEVDTGYLLAESLFFIGGIETAGMLMGMTRPVILNVPFVSEDGRLVELALASLARERGGVDG